MNIGSDNDRQDAGTQHRQAPARGVVQNRPWLGGKATVLVETAAARAGFLVVGFLAQGSGGTIGALAGASRSRSRGLRALARGGFALSLTSLFNDGVPITCASGWLYGKMWIGCSR